MEPVRTDDVGFEDYGHKKIFHIDKKLSKSVLITGAGSYIGKSFTGYCESHYPNIRCTSIDMVDGSWRDYDFSGFDTVFHVAGIAHADVGRVLLSAQEEYYKINTDLAIETAKKAKAAGCAQFIFMSSMIVYGGQDYVTEYTEPKPLNFYGNSKWLADKGIRFLASEVEEKGSFKVATLRPPMIYGKGSKGNYRRLSSLAKQMPCFPAVDNRRSMLYIDNFCEFVSLLMLSGESGVYFPQNREYSNTGELVKLIRAAHGKKVRLSKALAVGAKMAERMPIRRMREQVGKAFASSYYDSVLSVYDGLEYQVVGLEDSIRLTES